MIDNDKSTALPTTVSAQILPVVLRDTLRSTQIKENHYYYTTAPVLSQQTSAFGSSARSKQPLDANGLGDSAINGMLRFISIFQCRIQGHVRWRGPAAMALNARFQ